MLAYEDPILNIQEINGFKENIVNSGSGTIFKKEIRWSFDNQTFSEFVELSDFVLKSNQWDISKKYWFQFRYTLLSGGPSDVKGVSLNVTVNPGESFEGFVAANNQDESKVYAFPITYKAGAKWNPYKMNRSIRLFKDLNLMVNSLFGHDVTYYRVLPKGRSKDVFLLEYSLYEHDAPQCMKIVVPNNQFPDNKLGMGPFGIDFEMPFEVQVDKSYFQEIFGEGSGPQKRDVIYFSNTNRVYEISSAYLFRDFMNEPLYFKMTLVKWLPKSNVESSPEIDELESLIPSVESLFGIEMDQQEIDIANPQQFVQTTDRADPVRFYLDANVTITENPVINNYLNIAEYQYAFASSVNEDEVRVNLTSAQVSQLVAGTTYYARYLRTSSQPNDDFYYSMRTLLYLGTDQDGLAIFRIMGGNSSLSRNVTKSTIFGPTSSFHAYSSEYVSGSTAPETPLFQCNTKAAMSCQNQVVKYKATGDFNTSDDRAFSAWFNVTPSSRFLSTASTVTVDETELNMTIHYDVPHSFFVGDYVSLRRSSGGNFNLVAQITSVNGEKDIEVSFSNDILTYVNRVFPSWKTYVDFTVQLTYPKVFMDNRQSGKGIRIDLLEKRFFRVFSNSNVYCFFLPNTQPELVEGKWYSLCVSFSNLFSQLTLNVWEMKWDPATNLPFTSDLNLYYGKMIQGLVKEDRSSSYNYFLEPSDCLMTNIRVWAQKIETDKQPLVLNQSIVKDASRAIVIDNAIPPSRLPYFSYTQ